MDSRISSQLSGGKIHNTGYSQGAAATTNALSDLTRASFDAVKGVFLIGNPEHRAGLACNIDTNGGTRTLNANGLSATLGRIPDNWVSKTLDVCNFAEGVCDPTSGRGTNAVHLAYPRDASTQNIGTEFGVEQLTAGAGGAPTTPTGAAGAPALTYSCRYSWS